MLTRLKCQFALAVAVLAIAVAPASAQDRLCDPGNEDCRAILINYIRSETVGIDVAFWFMEDARYTNELIARWRAGVPVRVLMDSRANSSYPLNAERLAELRSAGIPMRRRLTSYILHWKTMLFHGQNVVEFSGANYSANAWRPETAVPYENYIDEGIYFTSDTAIVNSFRTRFDDQWVDTTDWTNYANVAGALTRRYGIFPKDPSLNFAPWENYRTRAVNAYNAERWAIDVIMYRITDRAHADAMISAVTRGVPVRLITEPEQYRDPDRMWHAWNVDRLYMAGVQIKHRAHAGLNHQKSVILHDQDPAPGNQTTVIFGSSNWTSPSAAGQVEHNIFTTKPYITSWFIDQFARKWNNLGGIVENVDFVPLPPDAPRNPVPAVGATNVSTTLTTHVVRRSVGAPLRRLPRHQSQPDDADRDQPGRAAVEDRDQYVQLLASGHPADRHHVLLAGRRQDDGAAGQVEPRMELQDSRMSRHCTATSMATAVPTSQCSARRVVSGSRERRPVATATGRLRATSGGSPPTARLPEISTAMGDSISSSTGPRTAAGISAIPPRATP